MTDAALAPDLVIFDCDGVIVDSEAIAHRVVAEMLTRAGWSITPAEAEALFIGGTVGGVVAEARTRLPDLPADFAEQIYAEMYRALEATRAIPGIVDVLDALDAAGLPYAVGSNGPHEKMAVTLGAVGLADRLAGKIVSARDVTRPKPAPDVFVEAAARAGVAPPRALVVGDSRADIGAAAAAGMRFIGYAGPGGGKPEIFEAADQQWIDDLRLLPARIGL